MTENKAIDDLLKPRYKVMAEDTSDNYTVGDIFIQSDDENYFVNTKTGFEVPAHIFPKYPHLFKKLEWWEERQESEMPEYIKFPAWHDENETEFLHVDGKESYHHFNQAGYFGVKHRSGGGFYIGEERSKFLPATEAEYLNYQKQKS